MSWDLKFSTFVAVLKNVQVCSGQLAKHARESKLSTDIIDLWVLLRTAIHCLQLQLPSLKTPSQSAEEIVDRILQCLDTIFTFPDSDCVPPSENEIYDQYANLWALCNRYSSFTGGNISHTSPTQPSCIQDKELVAIMKEQIEDWTLLLQPYDPDAECDTGETNMTPTLERGPSIQIGQVANDLHALLAARSWCSCGHHTIQACIVLSSYRHLDASHTDRYIDFIISADDNKFGWQEVCIHTDNESNLNPGFPRVTFQQSPSERPPLPECWQVKKPPPIKSICSQLLSHIMARRKQQNWLYRSPDELCRCSLTDRQFLQMNHYSLVGFYTVLDTGIGNFSQQLLAVMLSFALLHLCFSPWLPSYWPKQNIRFLRGGNYTFLRPLLLIPMPLDANQEDPDVTSMHKLPILAGFAGMLIELYEGRSLSAILRIDLEETNNPDDQYLIAQEAYEKCRKNIRRERWRYNTVIKSCLNLNFEIEDFESCSNDDLRRHIFNKIVIPLEDELLASFEEYDPLQNLDAVAARLDMEFGTPVVLSDNDQMASRRSENQVCNPNGVLLTRPPPTPQNSAISGWMMDMSLPTGAQAENEAADAWIADIHRIRQAHNLGSGNSKNLKIAILDTGIDKDHPFFADDMKRIKPLTGGQKAQLDNGVRDEIGHGTFITHLILNLVPTAEVYIAKITNSRKLNEENARLVAAALRVARETHHVDMITMSFGFQNVPRDVEIEIDMCIKADILLFAAASNNGGKRPATYPGNRWQVFGIYSANHRGIDSGFNPPPVESCDNFSTLGEIVFSAWPTTLNKPNEYGRRMNGTSVATPIAVSISALFMEWCARNLTPENTTYRPNTYKGMQSILSMIAVHKDPVHKYLDPTYFFLRDDRDDNWRRTKIKDALA